MLISFDLLNKLNGFPHLQTKIIIYYYSFGTPSTKAIRHVINETNLYKNKHPDKNPDEMTTWRYYYRNKELYFYGFAPRNHISKLAFFELDYYKINSEWCEFHTPALNVALEWCLQERKKIELHRFIKSYYTQDACTPSSKCIKPVLFQCSVLPDKSLIQILKKKQITQNT